MSLKSILNKLSFLKNLDLKPRDNSKIALFANKGEAIVFWVSVAGLVFLGMIVLSRHFMAKRIIDKYDTYVSGLEDLSQEVDSLKTQNALYMNQIDSLKKLIQQVQREGGDRPGPSAQSEPELAEPPEPDQPTRSERPETRPENGRDAELLNRFRIKKVR
jgi:hypothetical protein